MKKFAGTKAQEKDIIPILPANKLHQKFQLQVLVALYLIQQQLNLRLPLQRIQQLHENFGVKDFTYSIEKDGKTFIKKDAVESAPSGIYTEKLEITDTPFTAYGDYEISVTAQDNLLNTATGTHKIALVVPPMSCVEWPG